AFAHEFVLQVGDWIDSNPCHRGVNWSCTMDVGIRAVNWIWAFHFFRKSDNMDGPFTLKLVTSLYEHARFIRQNLEYQTVFVEGARRRLNSNHYLSNLAGLLYIALLFPELGLGTDAEFAQSELET